MGAGWGGAQRGLGPFGSRWRAGATGVVCVMEGPQGLAREQDRQSPGEGRLARACGFPPGPQAEQGQKRCPGEGQTPMTSHLTPKQHPPPCPALLPHAQGQAL